METDESTEYRSKLIDLVHKHDILWNRGNKFVCNRVFKMEAWNVVARELGKTPEQVVRNWQNLRGQYRRELRRELQYNAESSWVFYNKMSFIREFLRNEYHADNQEAHKTLSDSESDMDVNNIWKDVTCNLSAFGQLGSEIDASQTSNTSEAEIKSVPKEPDLLMATPKPRTARASKRKFTKNKHIESNENSPCPPKIVPLILASYVNDEQQQSILSSKDNNLQDTQIQSEDNHSVPCDSFEDKDLSLKLEIESDDEEQPETGAQLEPIVPLNETNECENNGAQLEPNIKTNEYETSENSTSDHFPYSNQRTSEIHTKGNETNKHFTIGQEDEDYYFVLSLLPHLRRVKMDRKLTTRVDILKVVMENLD